MVPQRRCPILKPLSAKLPPKSETAPHSEWQNGKILGPGGAGKVIKFKRKVVFPLENVPMTSLSVTPLSSYLCINPSSIPLLNNYFAASTIMWSIGGQNMDRAVRSKWKLKIV